MWIPFWTFVCFRIYFAKSKISAAPCEFAAVPWVPRHTVWEPHACMLNHSVVSDSLWPHGLKPSRLLCPWDFPGKNTRMGCHFLLQRIFPTQGLNPHHFGSYVIWVTKNGNYKYSLCASRQLSINSAMPSNHLILCHLLLLLPLVFPSIRVFSHESALHIK